MSKSFDSGALGSDVARSRKQYLARSLASMVVRLLRLNRDGLLSTEIVQAINPIATVDTQGGPLYCRAGHGRLVWRARTFFDEEPETIAWLDRLTDRDVYWDIGANVGMYAVYAAKFRRCSTIAFEPEGQNYALLTDNIVLNEVGDRCLPVNIAVADRSEMSRLRVRYITKGGAYNMLHPTADDSGDRLPESFLAAQEYEHHEGFDQLVFGCSIDQLIARHGLPPPTFMKIDVDGVEPAIIAGASDTLASGPLRSILVELNMKSASDRQVPDVLARYGFRRMSARSNWDSRTDKTYAARMPAVNMIFERG